MVSPKELHARWAAERQRAVTAAVDDAFDVIDAHLTALERIVADHLLDTVDDTPIGGTADRRAVVAAVRRKVKEAVDGTKGGFDDLGFWHDPNSGKFAPKGFVSALLLKGLLAGDGKSRSGVIDAFEKKLRDDPSWGRGGLNRASLDAWANDAFGDRPTIAGENQRAWDAGRRELQQFLGKKQVTQPLVDALNTDGGFTATRGGMFVDHGVAVAVPGNERRLDASKLDTEGERFISEYINQMRASAVSGDVKIGGWYDRENGEIVLDQVEVFTEERDGPNFREKAIEAGVARGEQAVFDIDHGEEIDTGGVRDKPKQVVDTGAFTPKTLDELLPENLRGNVASGDGSRSAPWETQDVQTAAALVAQGQHVSLQDESQVGTFLTHLKDIANDAKAKGEKAPNYNLCLVSVPGTNLFCAETEGIPRVKMPQFATDGPTPGSFADKLTRGSDGKVDISSQFIDYLRFTGAIAGEGQGVTVDPDTGLPVPEFVDPSTLKASQDELAGAKVAGIMGALQDGAKIGGTVFVSSDNYVIDGHHRWAAYVGAQYNGDPMMIDVVRVDMPIIDVLALANVFTERLGIPHAAVFDTPDPTPEELAQLEESLRSVHFDERGIARLGLPLPKPNMRGEFSAADQIAWRDKLEEAAAALPPVDQPDARAQALADLFVGNPPLGSPLDSVHQYNHLGAHGDGWSPERSAIHDELIDSMLGDISGSIPQENKAVFTAGLPGAGKTTALRENDQLTERGIKVWDPSVDKTPPAGATHVVVSADTFKEQLAERGLVPDVNGLTPMEESALVHTEASYLAQQLFDELTAQGYNVVMDGTLRGIDTPKVQMAQLHDRGYSNVVGVMVDASPELSRQSSLDRYTATAGDPLGARLIPDIAFDRTESRRGNSSVVRDNFDDLVAEGFITDAIVVDREGKTVRPELADLLPPEMHASVTSGDGSRSTPYVTANVDAAAALVAQGQHVNLMHERQVSTLLDRLTEFVKDAQKKGEDAPNYNLCLVSVGANLFCSETKGIPRIEMPQFSTKNPVPGSIADALPRNDKGEVDVSDQFIQRLKDVGISVSLGKMDADHLKASQRELDGSKVAGINQAIRSGKPMPGTVFVSSDDYIVDGHHRWAALAADFDPHDMDIVRIDMPILDLLSLSNAFTKEMGLPQAAVFSDPNAPDLPDYGFPSQKVPEAVFEQDPDGRWSYRWVDAVPNAADAPERPTPTSAAAAPQLDTQVAAAPKSFKDRLLARLRLNNPDADAAISDISRRVANSGVRTDPRLTHASGDAASPDVVQVDGDAWRRRPDGSFVNARTFETKTAPELDALKAEVAAPRPSSGAAMHASGDFADPDVIEINGDSWRKNPAGDYVNARTLETVTPTTMASLQSAANPRLGSGPLDQAALDAAPRYSTVYADSGIPGLPLRFDKLDDNGTWTGPLAFPYSADTVAARRATTTPPADVAPPTDDELAQMLDKVDTKDSFPGTGSGDNVLYSLITEEIDRRKHAREAADNMAATGGSDGTTGVRTDTPGGQVVGGPDRRGSGGDGAPVGGASAPSGGGTPGGTGEARVTGGDTADILGTNVITPGGESVASLPIGTVFTVNGVKVKKLGDGTFVNEATGEPVTAGGIPLFKVLNG